MRYIVSAGKPSEIMFSKVLPLSLRDPLAPAPWFNRTWKARGLLPPGIFLGCQSPHVVRVGAGLGHVWLLPSLDQGLFQEVGLQCALPCKPAFTPGCIYPRLHLSLPACAPTVTWGQWPEKGKWESSHPLLPSEGTLVPIWQGCSGQVVTCWLLILADSSSCKTFRLTVNIKVILFWLWFLTFFGRDIMQCTFWTKVPLWETSSSVSPLTQKRISSWYLI